MSDELFYARPGPITPVAGIGQNILVWRLKHYELFRVQFREGLPPSEPLMRDFGAIAAGATSAGNSLQAELEMPDFQLGQFRVYPLEDLRVTIWLPRSVGRYQVKNTVAQVTAFTPIYDPCLHTTEFFTFEDTWPYLDVMNPRALGYTLTRVVFYGFKYVLERIGTFEEITQVSLPYAAVVSEGY